MTTHLSIAEIIAATTYGIGKLEAEDAALKASNKELLAALKLAESVYRKNCVAEGEPSTVLAAMQAAIAKAEGQS